MVKLDYAIIVSSRDPAGMNIGEQLAHLQHFPTTISDKKVNIFVKDEAITELDDIDKEIDADVFVFASKHVSKNGVNSLTVHSIGNWGKAMFGGRDRTLVKVPANLLKNCFRLLVKKTTQAKLDYYVMQEATHHGPYLDKPTMFIEIGSSEERWKDTAAGKVVAATILEAIEKDQGSNEIKVVVGIGGMHHSPNFGKVMLVDDVAVSYVCPKYMLESLDADILKQAIEKSLPKASNVVLDWKGLGQEKGRIIKMLEDLGLGYDRTKDMHKK